MTRRERLMATLNGKPVDRPAVNFYEIGGFVVDPCDPDPYNIYNSPDWQPLLKLAEEHSDLIRMIKTPCVFVNSEERSKYIMVRAWEENGSRYSETRIKTGSRELKALTRRDTGVDTVWHLEHLIKDTDDLKAWLDLPEEIFSCRYDASVHFKQEQLLGDKGIVMVDFPDQLNRAARLMSMEDFTIMAFTEKELMHRLLKKTAGFALKEAVFMAEKFPGRLWRLTGAEYATEPYMSPDLFREYWLDYAKPIIDVIHSSGGFARVHSHGRIMNVLDAVLESGADAIDPIEPPPQGDVELKYVRERYGKAFVLFGNLEVTDIENLPTVQYVEKIKRAVDEGMSGQALRHSSGQALRHSSGQDRGFVLMQSASPYGRTISALTMKNYEKMIEVVEAM